MAIGTLQAIIDKVRRLTGSGTSSQLTEVMIKDYINSFYLYDLPAQFRSLKLKDVYTFDTIRGVETYAFDSEHYTTVESPCYCSKKEIKLFTDTWSFYSVYYNWQFFNNFDYGKGNSGPYSGFANSSTVPPNTQIISSSNNDPANINFPASRVQNLLITANTGTTTVNITDYPNNPWNGTGTLYLVDPGTPVGTINYITGAISISNMGATIPQGVPITIQYNPAKVNMPLSILFYQNQFTLRPVPDRGYTIELIAYRQPTQALNVAGNVGTPELIEWWELLAAGAAKKIYEDRLDPDGVALMDKLMFERYKVAEARTYAQLGSEVIRTMFTDQLTGNYGNSGNGLGAFT
jgi:hypothetical protein